MGEPLLHTKNKLGVMKRRKKRKVIKISCRFIVTTSFNYFETLEDPKS